MFVWVLVCGVIALDFCLRFVVWVAFRFFGLYCVSRGVRDLVMLFWWFWLFGGLVACFLVFGWCFVWFV